MTAQELIAKQMAQTEFMLGKAVEGLTDETAGQKVANLMSAKETVEHLCECYIAAAAHAKGEKHEWGKYSAPDKSWQGLLSEFKSRRSDAVRLILDQGDELAVDSANEYIVGHDHYHVGQLCALRIGLDPAWDSYCIYGG